jgi:hypothetical protein
MNTLKIGDTVIWRGAWGKAEPIEAKVKEIQLNDSNGSDNGKNVNSVEWSQVTEKKVIVTLENNLWAWAFQISEK